MEETYCIPELEAARVLCAAWTGMGAPATPDMFRALIRPLSCRAAGQDRAGDREALAKAAEEIARCSDNLLSDVCTDGSEVAVFSVGVAATIAVSIAPTFVNGLFEVCVTVHCDEEWSEMTRLVQFLAVVEGHHIEKKGLLVLAKAAIDAYRQQPTE